LGNKHPYFYGKLKKVSVNIFHATQGYHLHFAGNFFDALFIKGRDDDFLKA
jgi:hypothetical protein